MRHGSLFSGIGGFDLAAQWMGWENVFQVEIDWFCQKVLEKNFPNTKRYDDIRKFDATQYKGKIDIITAGWPCQPFSVAGKRRGKSDDRYLWPQVLRVIREIKPSFVVGENVTGIIKLALDEVLAGLEAEGYTTETFIIPACGKNAPHRRDRVWIIAYTLPAFPDTESQRTGKAGNSDEKERAECSDKAQPAGSSPILSDTYNTGCKEQWQLVTDETELFAPERSSWWETEPAVGRVVDGLPAELDKSLMKERTNRLKALGNAIVPQIAYEIFKAISKIKSI